MAYHIYDTEAFVLDERPAGEANKIFYLLTPALGLVMAQAQGIRLLKSKLRFHIARYAQVRASLVRGKETWRLTGVEKIPTLDVVLNDPVKLTSVAKVFNLLSKFIRGEGEQAQLCRDLKLGLQYLGTEEQESFYRGWELAAALRALNFLGYIKNERGYLKIINSQAWNREVVEAAKNEESTIVTAIEQASRASHF